MKLYSATIKVGYRTDIINVVANSFAQVEKEVVDKGNEVVSITLSDKGVIIITEQTV